MYNCPELDFCPECEEHKRADTFRNILTRARNDDGQCIEKFMCADCAEIEELAIEQELDEETPDHCKPDSADDEDFQLPA